MALEKEIEIKASTGDADEKVKSLTEGLQDLSKELKKSNQLADKQAKELKEVSAATKGTRKGLKSLGKGFKGVGLAIKASGIGIVLGLLSGLKSLLEQSQPVIDVFATSFQTVSTVIKNVVSGISGLVNKLSEANGGFDATKNVIGSVIKIALTPLKLAFDGIKLVVSSVALAWEKSPFGKGDEGRIKELTEDIEKTKESIKATGEEAVKAGKDIVTNMGEAYSEVSELVGGSIKVIKEQNIKATFEQSKALVELRKQAQLAVAQNELLKEQYDTLAERQRQIRDDVTIDIYTRKKANDELGKKLEKQIELQLKNADLAVKSARKEKEANKGKVEAEVAYINALKERESVIATVTVLRSEQLVNQQALQLESIELERSQTEALTERARVQNEFNANQQIIALDRIAMLQENIDAENQLLEEQHKKDKKRYKEGTQARVDADNQYLAAKQDIDNRSISLEREKTVEQEKFESAKRGLVVGTFSLLASFNKKNKALQIGQAIANTYKGVTEVWSSPSTIPEPFGTAQKVLSTGVVLKSGFDSVKNIKNSDTGGASPSTAEAPTASDTAQAPSFNIIEGTVGGQLNNALNNINERPVKTYVLSKDVTSQQEFDRNTDDTASI